jgi:hypothetical protein
MRTAIVFSGHMRTFDRCLPTMDWHIFRHYPAAHFFVSTVADADALKAQLLVERYGADRVKIDTVPEQPDCVAEMRAAGVNLPAEWHRGQPYSHEPYAISVHPRAVLRQIWQLGRAWTAFCDDLWAFDVVIRLRPDLWLHDYTPPRPVGEAVCLTPWWGRFGGVNDRCAVMGPTAAAAYFGTYAAIPALMAEGCPLHPESLVGASLWAARCVTSAKLQTTFSTLRQNGEMRPPEISWIDVAGLQWCGESFQTPRTSSEPL